MRVIKYKTGEKIVDILFFMMNAVTKDGEPCVVSFNGLMIAVAPDQQKLIQIPEKKIVLPGTN